MHDDQFQVGPNEPPPSYSPRTGSGGTSVASPSTFKTKPTNLLTLSTEDTNINGEFVIDPSIRLPRSFLPSMGKYKKEDRKNLSLTSRYSINADIWLLGSSSRESATRVRKPRRTTIALDSDAGQIDAKVHAIDGAAPFLLKARACQWANISLPRSFKGLLLLSTKDGSVEMSNDLLKNAAQLSQLGATQQYFVGDLRELGGEEWEGSRVEVEAPCKQVVLRYVDEVARKPKRRPTRWEC